MSPTPRAAAALAVLALGALFVPPWLALLAVVALAAATVADALSVSRRPVARRDAPSSLVRGQSAPLRVELKGPGSGHRRIRQPVGPDLTLVPGEDDQRLDAKLAARRRGRHAVPRVVARLRGPLGLGAWTHSIGDEVDLRVYPDLPGARRLAATVRRGRFREEGRRSWGEVGLGADFDTLRDYVPDDDIRQVNWLASARLGRPISNQFRIERDRDVICVIDCGRLAAAPVGDATRLDVAVDAAVAVCAVSEALGDRCGVLAFDAEIRRHLAARRAGTRAVAEALFDLEPVALESDYERAFRQLTRHKRAFVLVLTDLIELVAAGPLLDAVPILTRHHHLAVATLDDPDLLERTASVPRSSADVYRMAVALEVVEARRAVTVELARRGGEVVEAPPEQFSAACVSAYLRAGRRRRF